MVHLPHTPELPADNLARLLNLAATRLLPDLALSVTGGVRVWAPCPINTLEAASKQLPRKPGPLGRGAQVFLPPLLAGWGQKRREPAKAWPSSWGI